MSRAPRGSGSDAAHKNPQIASDLLVEPVQNKLLGESRILGKKLAVLSLFSVARCRFPSRSSEEMVYGGDGATPELKKMGVGRLHVLRPTKFYRKNCSGFKGRLGFPGTDDLVQRPVSRRRLWDRWDHSAAESAEACPARHL
jgi:hypothetical protein